MTNPSTLVQAGALSSALVSGAVRLLVAIPCLNEDKTVGSVISRIPRTIPGVDRVDVVVIDDGSIDATASVAASAGALVIRHERNRGVGIAFRTALEYAVRMRYELLVNIDGDGQFSPEDIPQLVGPVAAGLADMASASRFKDPALTPDMPPVKLWGNHMMSWLIGRLVRMRFADVSCGFRCYSREAMLRLNLHGAYTYTQESFLDFAVKGVTILEVPLPVQYFADRKSRVAGSIAKYALNAATIIFRSYRDYYPLRFFLGIAAILAVPGFVLGGLFLGHFLTTGKFTGYLFAGFGAGFLLLLSTLFVLIGIVADMLDRVRTNQDRILYFLKQGQTP
jgi:glycosyltransferase involved in cell wall biosynthesis